MVSSPCACYELLSAHSYTASENGYIQEVGTDFDGPNEGVWYMWQDFSDTDTNSGVSTVISNLWIHLYVRSVSSGGMRRSPWNYNQASNTSWRHGEYYTSRVRGHEDGIVFADEV